MQITLGILGVCSTLASFVALVICGIGLTFPALRREFIWLGLAALLHIVSYLMTMAPSFLVGFFHGSVDMETYQMCFAASGAISLASNLFLCIGLLLLVMRARAVAQTGR